MQGNIVVSSLGFQLPDGTILFENLSASFGAERTGLVGPNGAGKSTFLAILAGLRAPTSGAVTVQGRLGFHQQAAPHTDTGTVASAMGVHERLQLLDRAQRGEAAAEELATMDGWWDLEERLQAVFSRCGVPTVRPEYDMARLSGGERVRVRFAALLLSDPDFLLLDEPTNHLDRTGREVIYEMVSSWTRGLLVASHDRELLTHVSQVAELERGGLRFYGGNYESYRGQKASEQAAAAQAVHAAREKLEKARIHAAQATERQAKRSVRGRKDFLVNGGMPKILAGARKRRAQETAGRLGDVHENRISAAEETLRAARERHVENAPIHLDLVNPESKGSRRVLACEGANVQFADGRWLWAEDLSFTLTNGERVAIRGGNGAGKTFLLKMLAGSVEPTRGRIVRNTKRAVYLDQHTAILQPGTVLENARWYASDRDESELRLLLARMGLPNDAVFKEVGVLSGGERVRAALACLMAAQQAPDLLMLDEPDNHLDLQAMLTTSEALQRYEGTLVVVSHDEAFLESLKIDREVTLSPLPPLGESVKRN